MSGGIAYVLDVDNVLYKNLNKAMISIEKVENKYDKKELRDLIEAHVEATGSDVYKRQVDGILVPGGFGNRGTEGMILAAQYARVHKIPYRGICL